MAHFEEALQSRDGGGGGGGGPLECFEKDGTVLVMQNIAFVQDCGKIDGDASFLLSIWL